MCLYFPLSCLFLVLSFFYLGLVQGLKLILISIFGFSWWLKWYHYYFCIIFLCIKARWKLFVNLFLLLVIGKERWVLEEERWMLMPFLFLSNKISHFMKIFIQHLKQIETIFFSMSNYLLTFNAHNLSLLEMVLISFFFLNLTLSNHL